MIIKSKSYKHHRSFASVLSYILREQEQANGFVLTKFIKGHDVSTKALANQFLINESFRLNPRKNNVRLYMDVLSFHAQDTEKLTNEKLQIIAHKYLSLRAPNAMAVATVHRKEKEHTHLHICFSGVAYKTGKSIRISKADFQNKVKIPMEQFQQQKFPELFLSEINHKAVSKRKDKDLRKDVEKLMAQKGRPSEKQQLLLALETAFKTATSKTDFYKRLEAQGLTLYKRNGVLTGIQGKRKFRFTTLGYDKGLLAELDKDISLNRRLEMLRKLKQNRKEKDQNLDFRYKI